LGGGIAVALRAPERVLQLGLRLDAFASYFEATHFSEDDVVPDRKSRWLAGADLIGEAGLRFTSNLSGFVGTGLEGMLGRTDIYAHGSQVAVVPPFRVVGELGLRAGF
jgi:hypothetical protein